LQEARLTPSSIFERAAQTHSRFADGKEARSLVLSSVNSLERSLRECGWLHLATASAIFVCTALQIAREEMIRVMHEEHSLSEMYMKFCCPEYANPGQPRRSAFQPSERRLARILLLLAEFGEPGEPEPSSSHHARDFAEMVGTTRSRVCFFMNRFRKLGLIEYNGRIRVHRSLDERDSARSFHEQQSCANAEKKWTRCRDRSHG